MRVVKFGGSSLADAGRMRGAAKIVRELQQAERVVAVVSALSGVTDGLLRVAADGADGLDELAMIERRHRDLYAALGVAPPERFDRHWDELRAMVARHAGRWSAAAAARFSGDGERLTVDAFAAALATVGVAAAPFPTEPVVLASERGQAEAEPSLLATRAALAPRLAPAVRRGATPVVPGYIARDALGRSTTLGRNGSDHSAAVVAAALGASELRIYSDVAGIFSADPRLAPDARLLPALTYAEAAAIARLGAQVLHPRTVEPLANWQVPLRLRSALAPDEPGTDILPNADDRQRAAAFVVAARPADSGRVILAVLALPAWPSLSAPRLPDDLALPAGAVVLERGPALLRLAVPATDAAALVRALHAQVAGALSPA